MISVAEQNELVGHVLYLRTTRSKHLEYFQDDLDLFLLQRLQVLHPSSTMMAVPLASEEDLPTLLENHAGADRFEMPVRIMASHPETIETEVSHSLILRLTSDRPANDPIIQRLTSGIGSWVTWPGLKEKLATFSAL